MADHVGFFAGRTIAEPMSPEEAEAAVRDFHAMLARRGAESVKAEPPTHVDRLKALFDEMGLGYKARRYFGGRVRLAMTSDERVILVFNPDGSFHELQYDQP